MIATTQTRWQSRLARIDAQTAALKAVGVTFFVCGAIGMVLPLVPTTELWMVAAYCFAKSAPELAERMFTYPRIGAELRNWVEHGVLSRKVKLFAMIGLSANFTSVVWVADLSGAALATWGGVVLAIAGYVGTRPEGKSELTFETCPHRTHTIRCSKLVSAICVSRLIFPVPVADSAEAEAWRLKMEQLCHFDLSDPKAEGEEDSNPF